MVTCLVIRQPSSWCLTTWWLTETLPLSYSHDIWRQHWLHIQSQFSLGQLHNGDCDLVVVFGQSFCGAAAAGPQCSVLMYIIVRVDRTASWCQVCLAVMYRSLWISVYMYCGLVVHMGFNARISEVPQSRRYVCCLTLSISKDQNPPALFVNVTKLFCSSRQADYTYCSGQCII